MQTVILVSRQSLTPTSAKHIIHDMSDNNPSPSLPYVSNIDLADPHVAVAWLRALIDVDDSKENARELLIKGLHAIASANYFFLTPLFEDRE